MSPITMLGIAALIVLIILAAGLLLAIWSLCHNDPMGEVDRDIARVQRQIDDAYNWSDK